MLAESEALPLGFVAIVYPEDLGAAGDEPLGCRATCVVGDPWTIAVSLPRSTLRPVCFERAAGMVERLAATGHATTARAGYPLP
jgi:hypothetical protein